MELWGLSFNINGFIKLPRENSLKFFVAKCLVPAANYTRCVSKITVICNFFEKYLFIYQYCPLQSKSPQIKYCYEKRPIIVPIKRIKQKLH